jgi:hypothetical protein
MSEDYRKIEFFGRIESLEKIMTGQLPQAFFSWDSGRLAVLQPEAAGRRGGAPILRAVAGDERWIILFRSGPGDGTLLVDGIEGFTPRIVLQARWEERLLPRMEVRRTEHFDIYYAPSSTAARRIEEIVAEREKGFAGLGDFLASGGPPRIRLVLFEDSATKFYETGHQGLGWAYGDTMVEVFNETERLDPFHELVHVLAADLGAPPAAFSEGLAVYLAERMGADALANLGGGKAKVAERAAEIRRAGGWIGLETLLAFREIGSAESRPDAAYPEAGAFIGYLLDRFGRDKVLEAYRRLKDPDTPTEIESNRRAFAAIFGLAPSALEADWLRTL